MNAHVLEAVAYYHFCGLEFYEIAKNLIVVTNNYNENFGYNQYMYNNELHTLL